MFPNKRQIDESNDEPSTSNDISRHLRKKNCNYVQNVEIDESFVDFDDSGSDWEATLSEAERIQLKPDQPLVEPKETLIECWTQEIVASNNSTNNVSVNGNSTEVPENSVDNAHITEHSSSNTTVLLTDNAAAEGRQNNGKYAREIIFLKFYYLKWILFMLRLVWTLDKIRECELNGSMITVPRHTTVRQSGKVTSEVWKSFHVVGIKINGEEVMTNFAKCKKCSGYVQFYGSTTTQLKRHRCENTQPQINEYMQNRSHTNISQNDITEIHNAASKFIALDIRPFSAVDGDGLRTLVWTVAKIARKYRNLTDKDIERLIPHRSTVSRNVSNVSRQAIAMITEDFKRALECPGGFSCTTDLYSDCFKCNTYLGITASLNCLCEGKITQKRYVIHLDKIEEVKKSAANIWKAIKECFNLYKVSEQQIIENITWVTDRGLNIKNALDKCKRMNCYAHIINNIVKYMCEKDSEMKDIVSNGASLVRYMKLATVDKKKLKTSLKSHCETRWNTVYYMLFSIIDNYAEIYQILSEKERSSSVNKHITEKLTCLDKRVLESVCSFLELFKNISVMIEGDKYETIHQVWPAYSNIEAYLQPKYTDEPIIDRMKELGRKYILEHAIDIKPDMYHKVAVILHPLMKTLRNVNIQEREAVVEHVESLVLEPNEIFQQTTETSDGNNNQSKSTGQQLFDGFMGTSSQLVDEIHINEVHKYINFSVNWVFLIFDFHIYSNLMVFLCFVNSMAD